LDIAVAAATRPVWSRPTKTLTRILLVRGITRSPAFCPGIGAVLATTSRVPCPAGIAAALPMPPISSDDASVTDSADVVKILRDGISFPLLADL
jgi:hypothetical protein